MSSECLLYDNKSLKSCTLNFVCHKSASSGEFLCSLDVGDNLIHRENLTFESTYLV